MRKFKFSTLTILLIFIIAFAVAGTPVGASADGKEVYIGGIPAGFTLGLGGAQVVGICEVLTVDGAKCPAKEAEIYVGDIILTLNGVTIESAKDLDTVLAKEKKTEYTVEIQRDGEEMTKEIKPAKDITSGKRKLGVLVRDSVSGIGTVTYIEKDTLRFGSLGHPVMGENGAAMKVAGGKIYNCSIVNVVKGIRGKAGELKGVFLNDTHIATAEKNCDCGIFGQFKKGYDFSRFKCAKTAAVGDTHPGKASIFTTIDGITPKEYSVSNVKVDKNNKQNKNFVIKITDDTLLAQTGGIVQGMSGSPIIQDGKLIGAVTHVFLNDPTRGYGISVDNMFGN